MAKIAAELLIDRLIDWGVDTVFGLPGNGINGITEALRRTQDVRSPIPNLFITDGSALPTHGSANPALTIMALASRAADYLDSANRAYS